MTELFAWKPVARRSNQFLYMVCARALMWLTCDYWLVKTLPLRPLSFPFAWDVRVEVQASPLIGDEDRETLLFGCSLIPQAWTEAQAWPRSVPEWGSLTWDRIAADFNLSNALLVFHEGLRLEAAGHPSFAFAAYVATFESIGARTEDLLERCGVCRTRLGAMRRFRAGIELVAEKDGPTFKKLKESYEALRSSTVHTGELHGGEIAGNLALDANPFVVLSDHWFVISELSEVRTHARRALELLLSG